MAEDTPRSRSSPSSFDSFRVESPEPEPVDHKPSTERFPSPDTGTIDDNTTITIDDKQVDRRFYYTLITFKVENVIFRVPRGPFETESVVFKEMFEIPSDAFPDGNTDEKPLILEGITIKDFRPFLRAIFDPVNSLQADLNQEEWISVLRLAHMWSYVRLFSLAVSKLSHLEVDPLLKISLARAYGINDWLLPAYYSLVTQAAPLTLEDANKLGMDTAMKLTEVRESRYRWIIDESDLRSSYNNVKKSARSRSPLSLFRMRDRAVASLKGDVHDLIKQMFRL